LRELAKTHPPLLQVGSLHSLVSEQNKQLIIRCKEKIEKDPEANKTKKNRGDLSGFHWDDTYRTAYCGLDRRLEIREERATSPFQYDYHSQGEKNSRRPPNSPLIWKEGLHQPQANELDSVSTDQTIPFDKDRRAKEQRKAK